MAMAVPGSERFSSRPVDPAALAASLPESLPVHTVTQEQIDALDPLTYEVVRHRLWSVTDEMGEALKRMSGSPIVTDANDFDFAVSDELGQEVQVGLYNTMLVGAVDLAIYWTLQHRASNPGIVEGDMFLCNDPWVGGGLHQNDAMVYQPVFWEGKLFGWTSAIAHQPDLGGVGLGSFSPAAQDVFSESLPTPPTKVVRDGLLQDDVADIWVRRSRVPLMIGLDLRAKVGANTVGRDRLLAVIAQYGADTVKAVMKRMMTDAESRLRGKLRGLPNGTWRATGYQDQSHTGDRNLHKITVAMTKDDDHLTFDFTGTDPQTGVINCTYAGMRGGVMLALLPLLARRHPVVGGRADALLRPRRRGRHDQQRELPGGGQPRPDRARLAHRQPRRRVPLADARPVAASRACTSRRRAAAPGTRPSSRASTSAAPVPNPFLSIMMDPMAGGYGAQPEADGMDTGGLFCIPMGRVPDVEMTEFLYPVLALWRREEPDSGGPGRRRGGVSASMAITPHGTSFPIGLVLASAGKAVSQNNGLAGGYPGNTGVERIARGSDLPAVLADGRLPADLDEIGGEQETCPCYGETYVAPGEVFTMFWQGGGGYGDPLTREPEDVARDVRELKVGAENAPAAYGVVLDGGGAPDLAATERLRAEMREARRSRGVAGDGQRATVDVSAGRRLDDNLVAIGAGADQQVACRHCATLLGTGTEGALDLVRYEGPATDAGPQIAPDADFYVDQAVQFRQYCCPGCFTAISTAVVPADHVDDITRASRVLADAGR